MERPVLKNLEGKRILLGSQSPRRQELLRAAGIEFTIDTGNTFTESIPEGLSTTIMYSSEYSTFGSAGEATTESSGFGSTSSPCIIQLRSGPHLPVHEG